MLGTKIPHKKWPKLKTINFYTIDSEYKKVPPCMLFSNKEESAYKYVPIEDNLQKQIEQFDIDAEIHQISLESIPVRADSHLICFLDQNSLIPSDYVARIIAMNNLHTDAVAFCGPVFVEKAVSPTDWFISKIAAQYKRYSLDGFDSFISCTLNEDQQNYPDINGLILIGQYYNKMGGISIIKDRHIIPNVSLFLNNVSSMGDIVYSSRLSTGYFVTSQEFNIENFSKYYYKLGYLNGLKSNNIDMKYQFAKNNNLLEIESLSWITQNEEVKDNDDYIKHIAIFKCIYELGFFEAFTKTRII